MLCSRWWNLIHVNKVRWKNFLSTGRTYIEIDLDNHKSTLIIGLNGSGKSTLLDALSFVLFNKPFREVNKGQLVNTITKKETVVEAELTINGKQYLVRRGIKPNVFQIYIDGVEIPSDADSRDFQSFFEKQILRLNHKSFTQVVMLGSALFVPFMKLKAAQRREVVEDLLDLQIFTQMNALLKDHNGTLNTDISDTKRELENTKNTLEVTKRSNAALKQNSEDQITERLVIIAREQRVADIQHEKIAEYQAQLEAIGSVDTRPILEKRNKLKDVQFQIEYKIETWDREITWFQTHDQCTQCAQDVSEDHKYNIVRDLEIRKVEVAEGLDRAKSKIIVLDQQLSELTKKVSERHDIETQIKVCQGQLWSNQKLIQQYNQDIISLRKPTAAEQDTSGYELKIIQLDTKLDQLMHEQRVASYASVLLKDGGIKSQVIKQYVPIFNELINKYLTSLDFFVDFNLDENFNETIRSRFRDEFTYNSFSEGQKMRIDLALMFTWRAIARQRNSIDINILVLDEVFDSSLDDAGTEDFLALIHRLTSEDNVIVISHKGDAMKDKFARTLQFALVKNFSQMAVL